MRTEAVNEPMPWRISEMEDQCDLRYVCMGGCQGESKPQGMWRWPGNDRKSRMEVTATLDSFTLHSEVTRSLNKCLLQPSNCFSNQQTRYDTSGLWAFDSSLVWWECQQIRAGSVATAVRPSTSPPTSQWQHGGVEWGPHSCFLP